MNECLPVFPTYLKPISKERYKDYEKSLKFCDLQVEGCDKARGAAIIHESKSLFGSKKKLGYITPQELRWGETDFIFSEPPCAGCLNIIQIIRFELIEDGWNVS